MAFAALAVNAYNICINISNRKRGRPYVSVPDIAGSGHQRA